MLRSAPRRTPSSRLNHSQPGKSTLPPRQTYHSQPKSLPQPPFRYKPLARAVDRILISKPLKPKILLARYTTSASEQKPYKFDILPPDNNIIEKMMGGLDHLEGECLERIVAGAMSHGSLGLAAHKDMAEAANRMSLARYGGSIKNIKALPVYAGPKSNSGEGGELEERDNTIWASRIRQVASGRFGVEPRYLVNAAELQIKMAQGAKPGFGGELPGEKVTKEIARARLTQPGIKLTSPPPLHDTYSIEDFKQLVYDLRSINPEALVSVKLAAIYGVGVVALGVAKAGVDKISLAGPGGTGAAPLDAKFGFVHPWEAALAETHQMLIRNGWRNKVRLIVSGGIQTGLDIVKANFLGADEVELGTYFLVTEGCINAKVCHNNECPAGIATNNQSLIDAKYRGKPEHVAKRWIGLAKSWAEYLREYGFTDPKQAVGRTDLLRVHEHSPLKNLEWLLEQPTNPYVVFGNKPKTTGSSYLESTIITDIKQGKTKFDLPITNTVLSFGANIAYHSVIDPEFAKRLSQTIEINFKGIPGQSFGFAAPAGLIMTADNSNDGTGKSAAGVELYIKGLTGNQAAYGATRKGFFGSRFFGDRAFVRNSGMDGVCEQMGENGVNFMTGGRVTILGHAGYFDEIAKFQEKLPALHRKDVVGPNLGAGMTGGQLILPRKLYEESRKKGYLNKSLSDKEALPLNAEDAQQLFQHISKYKARIPSNWVEQLHALGQNKIADQFVKLDPLYKQENIPADPLVVSETIQSYEQESRVTPSSVLQLKDAKSANAKTTPIQPTVTAQSSTLPKEREKDACGTGFLVRRDGVSTRSLVSQGLMFLKNISHRGSEGIDPKTSDGFGMALFGLHGFFQQKFPGLNLKKGDYGVIHVALPREAGKMSVAVMELDAEIIKEGLSLADFRDVPINNEYLGYIGQQNEPHFRQYIVRKPEAVAADVFEKMLVRFRLRFEIRMQAHNDITKRAHIMSASTNQVIYKALVRAEFFGNYFVDYQDPAFEASAIVPHGRYATNTASLHWNGQPFEWLANNGENNCIRLVERDLTLNPLYRDLIGTSQIDLTGLSDSHIMDIYLSMLYLLGLDEKEMAFGTIRNASKKFAKFYNITTIPFEGPNASVMMHRNGKLTIVRDTSGFRPFVGMENDEMIVGGSEFALDVGGQKFNLPPAQPLSIDLSTGKSCLLEPTSEMEEFCERQLNEYKRLKKQDPIVASTTIPPDEKIEWWKIRAGWSQEVYEKVMRPLFEDGKGLTQSMGDQGPIEALVLGAYREFTYLIKAMFAQVTNPPTDGKTESYYMSLATFIGIRSSLTDIQKGHRGYYLSSPVLDNAEFTQISTDSLFNIRIIDTNYPVGAYETGIRNAIDAITKQCVKFVKEQDVNLLILSDVKITHARAPIPPILIASAVDTALMKAGLRRRVNIIMQTAYAYTGAHMAQLLGIGGVDAINPYLVFTYDEKEGSKEKFNRSRISYKKMIDQMILSFMTPMGILSLSAYRGCKLFNGYGLDKEVAELLGIESKLGGIGLQDIARLILTSHRMPKAKGLGKFQFEGQMPREEIWNVKSTNAVIKAARGEEKNFKRSEHEMDLLKDGWPRGWLTLEKPKVWSAKHPLPVCILGGGAAAFFQAMALLELNLPIKIIIVEAKVVNKYGLLGDGVAPDHMATRNQGGIFSKVINDPRVEYYGGLWLEKT